MEVSKNTSTILFGIAILSTVFAIACSVTIEVKPDQAVITLPDLEKCEGVEIMLTVHQSGKKSKTVSGEISNGQVVFESNELRNFDYGGTFLFELRIMSRSETCPFPMHTLFYTKTGEKLTSTGEDTYEISASKFTRTP